MLFLAESDVVALLSMKEAICLLRVAFARLAAGEAQNQPRRRLTLPTGAVLHSMGGACGEYFGTKIYSTHPRHGAHFLVILYRAEDARPLALLEANHLGQIRTGAASGLATDLMAREDAGTVGIIGSGFQARTQLEAMLAVRGVRLARVWSRTAQNRERFAREMAGRFGLPVEAVESARDAVEGMDIVVTATSAREPVMEDGWVLPGTHVNATGSNQAGRRELPGELVGRADRIAVDSMEQALMESGDLLLALNEAGWQSSRLVELKDVVSGEVPGRRTPSEITVFKSNGLGLEDVAVAGWLYEEARERGVGRELPVLYS